MDFSRHSFVSVNDTTVSNTMYLSFDAESTMSSAAFKTIEASDIHLDDNETARDKDISSVQQHPNSTLEANDESKLGASLLKTVKRISQNPNASPLRPFSKNILKEFNALCSTPSKEQISRSVDVKRGSAVDECMDLRTAFQGVDDDMKPRFDLLPAANTVDNKENTQTESCIDNSQLSAVEGLSSAIEQKLAMLSTTDEESVIETKLSGSVQVEEIKVSGFGQRSNNKANSEIEKTLKSATATAIPKHRHSVLLPKQARKSVCEPSLMTNRPSRITDVPKSQSLSKNELKKPKDTSAGIPQLIDRMIKIKNGVAHTKIAPATDKSIHSTGQSSLKTITNKKRTSLIPNSQVDKRPFSFTQRMSVVVKTTLNSPARKIARRTVMASSSVGRKGVYAPETVNKPLLKQRSSLIPTNKSDTSNAVTTNPIMTTSKKLNTISEQAPKVGRIIVRKSMCPLPSNSSTNPNIGNSSNKPRASIAPKPTSLYTCSVCNCQFRIKSLLDAHKRSHESDLTNTSGNIVKKQNLSSMTGNSSSSSSITTNVCKYCDKKFALVRALHIHLLEKCSKIPPGDKRKLEYTEMDHVEKAQLPHFHQQSAQTSKTFHQKVHPNVNRAVRSSTESVSSESKDMCTHPNSAVIIPSNTVDAAGGATAAIMAPPASIKKIKCTAHTGVYRTPSKAVPCYACKISFKSILEYTNHAMTAHSSNAATNKPNEKSNNSN